MAERVITHTPAVSGICTVFAGLTLNDVAIIIGIVVTIASFAVNLWFSWDKRKREISQKGK